MKPVLSTWILHRINEEVEGRPLTESELFDLLRGWNIDKKIKPYALKEAIEVGLIKKEGELLYIIPLTKRSNKGSSRMSKRNGVVDSLIKANFFEY